MQSHSPSPETSHSVMLEVGRGDPSLWKERPGWSGPLCLRPRNQAGVQNTMNREVREDLRSNHGGLVILFLGLEQEGDKMFFFFFPKKPLF